mmetsp:Transcript_4021/g.5304  ORF Transcript_4021/g.5304 Transcript_4021/m.5304 type:complete len:152 (-) Transcript_4021:702-1157(-)
MSEIIKSEIEPLSQEPEILEEPQEPEPEIEDDDDDDDEEMIKPEPLLKRRAKKTQPKNSLSSTVPHDTPQPRTETIDEQTARLRFGHPLLIYSLFHHHSIQSKITHLKILMMNGNIKFLLLMYLICMRHYVKKQWKKQRRTMKNHHLIYCY